MGDCFFKTGFVVFKDIYELIDFKDIGTEEKGIVIVIHLTSFMRFSKFAISFLRE